MFVTLGYTFPTSLDGLVVDCLLVDVFVFVAVVVVVVVVFVSITMTMIV